MKKYFDKTLLIYMALGLVNFLVCTGAMLLVYNYGNTSQEIAFLVYYSLSSTVSLILNRFVTFRDQHPGISWPWKFILCVIVCLDALGNAGISPADILGMRVDPSDKVPTWSADWLDFFDCIAEGILMPLGALLMSIMYGWELGPEVVHAEATCEGQKFGAYGWFRICIKYITPLAMLLVLYGQIKEFFF